MNSTSSLSPAKTFRGLNIALWILQVLLGAMFIMSGFGKATAPLSELSGRMTWVTDVPEALVRFIGVSELLGGLGLLLPSVLRIKPVLTPLAAVGLALVMLFAAIFHVMRGEMPVIGINLLIGALAIFIAWGRSKKAPIQPR
jgi:putative oxidoreductase